jgi:hypothetical protein
MKGPSENIDINDFVARVSAGLALIKLGNLIIEYNNSQQTCTKKKLMEYVIFQTVHVKEVVI